MPPRILFLGASGYIGGSVLAEFLKTKPKTHSSISALVRKPDQVDKLRSVGVEGLLFKDLDDFEAIREAASNHDIVIAAASARHENAAKACIEGLASRKETTGNEVHYVHTSGASMVGDWPETGRVDTAIHSDLYEDIYTLEKNFPESFSPVRNVDLFVVDFGVSRGVKTYVIPPPLIFGRGTGLFTEGVGQVHQMTQLALKKKQAVMIGSGSGIWNRIHILDLSNLYYLLVSQILSNDDVPHWKTGYYFAENGFQSWKSVAGGIGKAGKELGVFNTDEIGNISLQEVGDTLYEGSLRDAEGVLASNSRTQADRARQLLNWTPKYGSAAFEQEIKEVVGLMVAKD